VTEANPASRMHVDPFDIEHSTEAGTHGRNSVSLRYNSRLGYSFHLSCKDASRATAHAERAIVDRRVDLRRTVIWNGRLHRDGAVLECEVFDISAEGAKARLAMQLAVNATVVLEIDRLGMFAGEIRWRTADQVGIRFLESSGTIDERLRGKGEAPVRDPSQEAGA
jgi:PilZ domain